MAKQITVTIPDYIWESSLEYIKWLASKEDVELGKRETERYLKECVQQVVGLNCRDHPDDWIGEYYIPL